MKIARILICAAAAFAVWGIVPASANNSPWQMAEVVPITGTVKMKVHKFSRKHALKRKAIRQRQEYLRAVKQTKVRSDHKIAIFNKSEGSAKNLNTRFCASDPLRITALTRVVSWPIDQLVKPFVRPFKMTEPLEPWQAGLIDEREDTIQYLVRTATPGGTMTMQGPRVAIERLHPVFAQRLAKAIREARANGLPTAGIFSAYRPAGFGIGGFKDKFRSNHNIGQAVDMAGVGRPGSREAILWFKIAGRNQLFNPYGPYNRAEWNHFQPQTMLAVAAGSDIRKTVDRNGPLATKDQRLVLAGGSYVVVQAGLAHMWDVGSALIRHAAYLGPPPEGRRRYARRGHRTVYAQNHRHHRHYVRARKVHYAHAS